MTTKAKEVLEGYAPPTVTVLGSLSADTLAELVDVVTQTKNPKDGS